MGYNSSKKNHLKNKRGKLRRARVKKRAESLAKKKS
jgi:hypothetical protein